MQKIFQHIRKQPKQVRENYALGIAAVFTTVVLLVWIVARPQVGLLGEVSSQVGQTTVPFATLINGAKAQLAQLRGAVATTTKQETSAAETTSSADTLVLTAEDISIANATTTESTSTAPRAYIEVLIGTSSDQLVPAKKATSSATETAR